VNILAIVHQPDAGPGVFAATIAEAGHELELWQPTLRQPTPDPGGYGAVLTFGGGMHPDQEASHPWLAEEKGLLGRALEQKVPVLGVCLGSELLAEAAGGSAHRAAIPEIGWYPVRTAEAARTDPVMAELPPRFEALEWHSYASTLPPGATALAWSETCLQAFRIGDRAWGVQFHAEVTLETFESWVERYHADPDAVELGIAPERLLTQTRSASTGWSRLGQALCTRFIDHAASLRGRCARTSGGVAENRASSGGRNGDRKNTRT
jgi:GMP synthase-like glutamine amidotransferase